MDTALGERLIELRARIVAGFDGGNWEELGLLTGATQIIRAYGGGSLFSEALKDSRLLRDDDSLGMT